jgi:hypothetical protein
VQAAPPVPDRSRFVALEGCACTGAVSGQKVPVQLAVQVSDETQPGERTTRAILLGYFLDVGERSMLVRPGDADAPPGLVRERKLGLGMGCYQDTVVIAAGTRATAWSLTDGSRRWTQPLSAAYRFEGREPGSGMTIYCGQLSVRGGSVQIPVGKRGRAVLSVRSGRPRK